MHVNLQKRAVDRADAYGLCVKSVGGMVHCYLVTEHGRSLLHKQSDSAIQRQTVSLASSLVKWLGEADDGASSYCLAALTTFVSHLAFVDIEGNYNLAGVMNGHVYTLEVDVYPLLAPVSCFTTYSTLVVWRRLGGPGAFPFDALLGVAKKGVASHAQSFIKVRVDERAETVGSAFGVMLDETPSLTMSWDELGLGKRFRLYSRNTGTNPRPTPSHPSVAAFFDSSTNMFGLWRHREGDTHGAHTAGSRLWNFLEELKDKRLSSQACEGSLVKLFEGSKDKMHDRSALALFKASALDGMTYCRAICEEVYSLFGESDYVTSSLHLFGEKNALGNGGIRDVTYEDSLGAQDDFGKWYNPETLGTPAEMREITLAIDLRDVFAGDWNYEPKVQTDSVPQVTKDFYPVGSRSQSKYGIGYKDHTLEAAVGALARTWQWDEDSAPLGRYPCAAPGSGYGFNLANPAAAPGSDYSLRSPAQSSLRFAGVLGPFQAQHVTALPRYMLVCWDREQWRGYLDDVTGYIDDILSLSIKDLFEGGAASRRWATNAITAGAYSVIAAPLRLAKRLWGRSDRLTSDLPEQGGLF